jgi:hypothetical protein
VNVVQPDAGDPAVVVADGDAVAVAVGVRLSEAAAPGGGVADRPQDVSSRTMLRAVPASVDSAGPGGAAGLLTSWLSDRPQ